MTESDLNQLFSADLVARLRARSGTHSSVAEAQHEPQQLGTCVRGQSGLCVRSPQHRERVQDHPHVPQRLVGLDKTSTGKFQRNCVGTNRTKKKQRSPQSWQCAAKEK